jgi:hypothetical protein
MDTDIVNMSDGSPSGGLAAEFQIRNLISRYNRAIDDGRPEAAVELFEEDGAIEMMGNVHRGKAALREFYRVDEAVALERPMTIHHVSNTIIEFAEKGGVASAETDFVVVRRVAKEMEILLGGRFRDRVQWGTDRWRFAERRIVPLVRCSAPDGVG